MRLGRIWKEEQVKEQSGWALREGKRSAITMVLYGSLIFFWSMASFASELGRISGTVVDPSGAVVPSAIVVVRNSDSAVQETCRTDSDGLYLLATLPTGRYQLEVTSPAFKPY